MEAHLVENMINLKEAGRYSKYLAESITLLTQMPSMIKGKLIIQTEDHLKSKALAGAEDICDKPVVVKSHYDITAEAASELIHDMLEEKVKLANAIATFKGENVITVNEKQYSLDAAIEYAKNIRTVSKDFYDVLDKFEEETVETKAYDKTFNAELNQVSYEYPVIRKTTLAFEKDVLKTQNRVWSRLANDLSMEIESLSSLKGICFEMKYDYLDKFEALIAAPKSN